MALQSKTIKPNTSCVEHDFDIHNIKKDMLQLKEDSTKLHGTLEKLAATDAEFNISLIKMNNVLTNLIPLTDKVRKLEDRTIIQDIIEKIIWMGVGVFISILINQNFNSNAQPKIDKQIYVPNREDEYPYQKPYNRNE